jgi:hypothetical protein
VKKICSVEGCGKQARTKGLCANHYQTLWRTGSVEGRLPEKYGEKTKHPLYTTWIKAFLAGRMGEEWHDFWRFVEEIGPRPTDGKYRIKRLDESAPYSSSNCVWKRVDVSRSAGESEASYQRRRKEGGASKRPPYTYALGLKRNHGMTVEEYEAMVVAQGNLCAMCGRPERRTDPKGQIKRLAVDHCHKSQRRRALLCAACNTALGLLEDRVDLFEKAIAYLKDHSG